MGLEQRKHRKSRIPRIIGSLGGLLVPALAFGQAFEPPAVAPLNRVVVPDVNMLGILDGVGTQGLAAPSAWGPVTKANQRTALQALGKALFWEMQVGGDGVQACATCHYHAGADHRRTNQMNPGKDRGAYETAAHDLFSNGRPNQTLALLQYSAGLTGLPVSQAELLAKGATADVQATGAPGGFPTSKPLASRDVNDIVGSQGIRKGTHISVIDDLVDRRVDRATLATNSPGFNFDFSANATGVPDTVRQSTGRNAPSAVNAIYNLRNFWDGRADAFFNGRNPFGFRDPGAKVKVSDGGTLRDVTLRIPFSSLASQAVGPIGNDVEMAFSSRHLAELGRKLLKGNPGRLTPLYGQEVKCSDPLLHDFTSCADFSGSVRGLAGHYDDAIRQIFLPAFWDSAQCVDQNGVSATCGSATYSLMEYNFPLFFGLAIQAYEATLTSEETIIDLLAGGVAKGTVVNGARTVAVTNLSLEQCIAQARAGNGPAAVQVATDLCTKHYSLFIHPKARSGAESGAATNNVVPPGTLIGGCATLPPSPVTTSASPDCGAGQLAARRASLIAINRGLGRFFAGATSCGVCHANPEFTLATVAALTGFGAAPLPPLPPGQLRKIAPEAPTERMIQFNGQVVVYDSGFYNIGVRPTPEDIALGGTIAGEDKVPLAYSKLLDLAAGGSALAGVDPPFAPAGEPLSSVFTEMRDADPAGAGGLFIPTSATNLAPRPFPWRVACAPDIIPKNKKCTGLIVANERLDRFGAFKTPTLRNVKFTGPYFHNGAKLNLRQVVETYKTAGHFTTLNNANLAAGLRIFNLGVADEAALVEMMETGLTDWRLAHQEGKFSHPEICIPHGHDSASGRTILAGIPAVGGEGGGRLQTFEEGVRNITSDASGGLANTLLAACNVEKTPGDGIASSGLSDIDVPPSAP